jgi:cytochrome c oxidase accessory protein FixG
MNKNRFELDAERLASTDEEGHRVYIHPEDVKGKWRTRRHLFYWFLIILYLVLPWTHFAGKQTILLDIVHREFTFFGLTFYAHDTPIILLLFLIFIFTMGFITSQWGRAWCGWSCPQTVFIDTIYRQIERLIEGKARARTKLSESSWTLEKIAKKSIKWFIFTLVSLHIAHSFLGYFVGTRELFAISLHSPNDNWTLFTIMLFITGLCLFDFGWFREQFCIIACPYGRFQSVMMDENSLTIAYDYTRGEPRRQGTPSDDEGDCINCYHCVKACPTGIDIRRGTQLECIACTNCIDACDEIMLKIDKPTGLIRYDSENNIKGIAKKGIQVRPLIYLTVIAIALAALSFVVKDSKELHVTLIRGTGTPYKELKNGVILNLYKLRLDYKGVQDLKLDFTLKGNEPLIELITPRRPFPLKGGASKTAIIHFRFPQSILTKGNKKVTLKVKDQHNIIKVEKDISLVGPLL